MERNTLGDMIIQAFENTEEITHGMKQWEKNAAKSTHSRSDRFTELQRRLH